MGLNCYKILVFHLGLFNSNLVAIGEAHLEQALAMNGRSKLTT